MIDIHIVIPTFNRAEKLKLILSQLKMIPDNHFITIYDNASTDKTASVCSEILGARSRFTYIQRLVNVGANGNILWAIIEALKQGDMVWVIADDDEIDVDAFSCLSVTLDKQESKCVPDVIVVGACSERSDNTQWPIPGPTDIVNGCYPFWWHASFLPTLIFSNSYIRKNVTPDIFYVGGCYSQLLIYKKLLSPETVVVFSEKRIVYRGAGALPMANPDWWMISWLKIVNCFPVGFRKNLRKTLLGPVWRVPIKFIKSKAVRKSCGDSSLDVNYLDLMSGYSGFARLYFLLWLPITLLPSSLISRIYYIYRFNHSRKSSDVDRV
jgi:glycosyltransferase involved in cell wall biosynthesis